MPNPAPSPCRPVISRVLCRPNTSRGHARAMRRQKGILFHGLDRNKAHGRTGHRFAGGLRINRIDLAPLGAGLHMHRRDKPHIVAQSARFAGPVMGAAGRASMPIRRGSDFEKHGGNCARRRGWLKTMVSSSVLQWTWKSFLARPEPIVGTCMGRRLPPADFHTRTIAPRDTSSARANHLISAASRLCSLLCQFLPTEFYMF